MTAWRRWQELQESDYDAMARKLLSEIETELRETLRVTLDTEIPREIREIEVTLKTNIGETRRFVFATITNAIEFLESLDVDILLNDASGPAVWVAQKSAADDTDTE